MGWHYILKVKCKLLPEFIPFVEKEYLLDSDTDRLEEQSNRTNRIVYESFPKSYKDLIDIWNKLDFSCNIRKYKLSDNLFYCKLSKKVTSHCGDLRGDYERFVKDIIVPISSEIHECTIESDDNGCLTYDYTDAELRGVQFHLPNKIKYVEHVYNEDKTEIVETRVVYKHSIKKIQFLDLDRAYGLN